MTHAHSAGRRRFLMAATAAAVATALPRRAAADQGGLDVAVIGAGAAGLAAATQLAAAGYRVLVLEARDRIGGRALTEDSSIGVTWDRGCGWLRSAAANPWVGYARANNFDLLPDAYLRRLYDGGNRLDDIATTGLRGLRERMASELEFAGRRGLDVPAEQAFTVATRQDPWYPVAAADLTSRDGVEPSDFSALDSFRYDDRGGSLRVAKGCGALVAYYGRKVDVRLRTPVTRLRWSGTGVALDSPAGTLAARAVVVAVPASVVAQGGLAFSPYLPADVLQAHHDLPLGLINKVALRFRKDVLGDGPGEVLRQRRAGWRGMSYLVRVADSGVAIGVAAGALAHELEAAGDQATMDFALDELAGMLGNDVRRRFDRGATTAWARDPFSQGACSYCLPGRYGARERLTRPVGGRLVFAGEHTEQSAHGTLHGAYLSGLRAARQVAALLSRT